jgi:protein Hikeshi
VNDAQFVIPVSNIDQANHLVVFMTGQVPFPDGFAGGGKYYVMHIVRLILVRNGHLSLSVYFSWPSAEAPSWIYLGRISNNKPSAIFRLNHVKGERPDGRCSTSKSTVDRLLSDKSSKASGTPAASLFTSFEQNTSLASDALVGISVEPLTQLEQQVAPDDVTPSTLSSNVEFVSKMLNNFVNYVASFVQTVPGSSQQIVPLSIVQTWYNNFERRLAQNPNFWKQ